MSGYLIFSRVSRQASGEIRKVGVRDYVKRQLDGLDTRQREREGRRRRKAKAGPARGARRPDPEGELMSPCN